MQPPETRYAKSGDVSIAYQVVGDGPLDLVFVYGWVSHLDFQWSNPDWARFLERLASFSRLILFDKRGTGLSDPVGAAPSFDERMDDVRAVMDAVGSERAAVIGYSEGGVVAALFAATYPERTAALVIYESWPTGVSDPAENPSGERWLELHRVAHEAIDRWGEGESLRIASPMAAKSARNRRLYGAFERAALSPAMARELWLAFEHVDIRPVLPAIHVPTLVIHFSDGMIPVEGGRYLAEHIPGARYVELRGEDHLPLASDATTVATEIQEFLTGRRFSHDHDRVLATVLFTDIVASTARAAELGDEAWHRLLERHDASIRGEIARYQGREVKQTGDGFLVRFDGPARAIRCALAAREALREHGLEMRAGLHTGECELRAEDLGGIAVHIAARVAALAGPGEVLVSSTVKDLVVGSGFQFEERGTRVLKGVPGTWRLFTVGGEVETPTPASSEKAPGRLDRALQRVVRKAPGLGRGAWRSTSRQRDESRSPRAHAE